MPTRLHLHEDRLFPADPTVRAIARRLYEPVAGLPILSPHGHTDPRWFAANEPFTNATELLLAPDHYLYRMLYSQGVDLQALGVPGKSGPSNADPREAWRTFASNFHLFDGTPSSLWLNYVFAKLFAMDVRLDAQTADLYYDTIGDLLRQADFRPRALFDRFNIEVLATTESPVETLEHHETIRRSGWPGRVITAYRPDAVIDADHEAFRGALERFGEITGEDVWSWPGYLNAHRSRRAAFAAAGATSTDHGHPTAATADLSRAEAQRLFERILSGNHTAADAELFRATMLVEMARMSLDDGLVMQIHPGSFRNHNRWLFDHYGRDKGADIPLRTEYVHALKPLLDRYGNDSRLTVILFTLDESAYSRELAPLAGHYPALRLGPAWWFHGSPEGMLRFREYTTETAGFYNTVGFNDDTRAFLSIPARHDVARRIDCVYLAKLVSEHRLEEDAAARIAADLAYRLPKQAYKL
jgi:glucuronate isomerase